MAKVHHEILAEQCRQQSASFLCLGRELICQVLGKVRQWWPGSQAWVSLSLHLDKIGSFEFL